jgi:hypothetical protein
MTPRLITGVTGDQTFPACFLCKVRVVGTANLVGAVQIKQGTTVLETIPAAATPGTERDYGVGTPGTKFDVNNGVLSINMANSGDSVLVLFA